MQKHCYNMAQDRTRQQSGREGRWKNGSLIRESTCSSPEFAAFLRDYASIHRPNGCNCTACPPFFVPSNDQFFFRLHSVFPSSYLPFSLSLFFYNLSTVNFDKEPSFSPSGKLRAFSSPSSVLLPVESTGKKVFGDLVDLVLRHTLTLNLTMDSTSRGIWFGKSWSSIDTAPLLRVYAHSKKEIFGIVF